ncbi:Asp-tRNA(Asn)/Glu-tRNA(Gln) amidotransferase GatCAB subunit B, partial [bacterium]|nr:Asp-tRNA(Asn)/Glu-tRNA(Gln) amidotransferase GatCAB subunit B [bacterium]
MTIEEIAEVEAQLPELPRVRRDRYINGFGLTDYEAEMLMQTRDFANFFDEVAVQCGNGKQAANWMLGEVSRSLNETGKSLETINLKPTELADLIKLVANGDINLNTAKEVVYPALIAGEGSPKEIVISKGLSQVSDDAAIALLVRDVLAANPQQLTQYRSGKLGLRGFFVGQVMKAGQGRINPKVLNVMIDEAL